MVFVGPVGEHQQHVFARRRCDLPDRPVDVFVQEWTLLPSYRTKNQITAYSTTGDAHATITGQLIRRIRDCFRSQLGEAKSERLYGREFMSLPFVGLFGS